MRFATVFTFLAAAAGAIASALPSDNLPTTDKANPLHAPLADAVIKSGAPYTITWSPNAGNTVNLILRKGKPGSLDTLEIIAKNLPNNGAFLWTPSPQLAGDEDYAIQIVSSDPLTSNYSPQFKIESDGEGIAPSSTIQPTVTKAVNSTVKPTATYTGTASKPTDVTELADLEEAGVRVNVPEGDDESAAGLGARVGMAGVVMAVVGAFAVAL